MTELVSVKSSENPHGILEVVSTPVTPPRPTYVVDVSAEFGVIRGENLLRAQETSELRARVKGLEAKEKSADSHRTAMVVAVITAIITALGAISVVLFGRGG